MFHILHIFITFHIKIFFLFIFQGTILSLLFLQKKKSNSFCDGAKRVKRAGEISTNFERNQVVKAISPRPRLLWLLWIWPEFTQFFTQNLPSYYTEFTQFLHRIYTEFANIWNNIHSPRRHSEIRIYLQIDYNFTIIFPEYRYPKSTQNQPKFAEI